MQLAEDLDYQNIAEAAAREEQMIAEQMYLDRLGEQQENEAGAIRTEGKSFGSPSLIKYFVLILLLAVPNDLVDALEVTGYLTLVSWFLSLFLSLSGILVSWLFDSEQKKAGAYLTKLEALRGTLTHTGRSVYRVAKFFRKNPTTKLVAGTIAELIPFVSILPWSTIAAVWAYLDERKTYKNAREAGQEIKSEELPVLASVPFGRLPGLTRSPDADSFNKTPKPVRQNYSPQRQYESPSSSIAPPPASPDKYMNPNLPSYITKQAPGTDWRTDQGAHKMGQRLKEEPDLIERELQLKSLAGEHTNTLDLRTKEPEKYKEAA